jgi:phosphoesterase RecJ-like protein
MFTQSQLQEIKNLLLPENKVVIITHYNPDGDAIGSSLGLKHFLKTLGLEPTVIVPNDFPKFLKWMPEAKKQLLQIIKERWLAER